MNSKQAILYCRVSSAEQVDGTSLESQERICREYAEREGIAVLDVFVDKGESAKTADRPEFLKAIAYCSQKKHQVDYFIVYKLDRFSRNQSDHFAVLTTLQKHNVTVLSATEPVNDSPAGKFLMGTLSAMAEFDNSIRSERSSTGMKSRLQQGLWVWQAPLGYKRTEKGSVMVFDDNARYVQLAFSEYAKGTHTYKSLAAHLYKIGFRSKTGKQIQFQTIQKMLHNPLYCGIVQKPEWGIEAKGQHEPIVSEALFNTCQTSGRKHKGTKKLQSNPDFPLRRLVTCAWCEKPLTGSYSTGRMGKRYPYYHHHKQDCPHALSVKKSDLEASFVSFLEDINPTFEFANAFKEACMEIHNESNKKAEHQNISIKQRIAQLEQKKQNIFNNFEEGIYTKTDFLERKRAIEKELYITKSSLVETGTSHTDFEAALDYCLNFVTNTPETWKRLEKQPEKRLRFQNFIFEDTLSYTQNNGFGTAVLSPIYSIYQQYLTDESSLVIPRRIELRFHG